MAPSELSRRALQPLFSGGDRGMNVDVNIGHSISYGVFAGRYRIWPGAEGAQYMDVQYAPDWDRFIKMFVARIRRPLKN